MRNNWHHWHFVPRARFVEPAKYRAVCPDFEKVRRALGKFMQESVVNAALAVQSARNYRFLRQKGVTVRRTIDSLIATFCIENDHPLLHNDSDFDGYEEHLELRVIHQ